MIFQMRLFDGFIAFFVFYLISFGATLLFRLLAKFNKNTCALLSE